MNGVDNSSILLCKFIRGCERSFKFTFSLSWFHVVTFVLNLEISLLCNGPMLQWTYVFFWLWKCSQSKHMWFWWTSSIKQSLLMLWWAPHYKPYKDQVLGMWVVLDPHHVNLIFCIIQIFFTMCGCCVNMFCANCLCARRVLTKILGYRSINEEP